MNNRARLRDFSKKSKCSATKLRRSQFIADGSWVVISGSDILRFSSRQNAEWAIRHIRRVFPDERAELLTTKPC